MARSKKKFGTPNAEQLDALKQYAAWAGDNWKSKLSRDWMRAGSEWDGPYPLLQQVRNSLGPAWLAQFEFDVIVSNNGRPPKVIVTRFEA